MDVVGIEALVRLPGPVTASVWADLQGLSHVDVFSGRGTDVVWDRSDGISPPDEFAGLGQRLAWALPGLRGDDIPPAVARLLGGV